MTPAEPGSRHAGASALHRYRAERLLRKDFAGLRAKVLAVVRTQLRGKGVTLDPSDLEACYAQAWHGLYAAVLAGEAVENPSAWLVLVTFRRAIDEGRAAGRAGVGAAADGTVGIDDRAGNSSRDLAQELDDRARLRQVFEGLRTTLSKRECEAASLCYLQGLSRAQAAERMGISEARMGKLMEGRGTGRPGVASKVGGLLDTIRAGGWCEEQGSLMRAYAFGILDPAGERHSLAVAHCRACPACRTHVASLRGLASVLPLPMLSPAALVGATAGARATGAAAGRSGSAWNGLYGSLTAKLVVTGLVVLGGGYVLLGARAHGSPPAVHATRPASAPTSSSTLAKALVPAFGLLTTGRGRRARPLRVSKPASPARGSRAVGPASSHEFLPESRRHEQAGAALTFTPAPTSSPAPTRTPGAEGEFGIE